MRTPLRQKSAIGRAQTSTLQSYPAPVGGWNARDALAQMKETDAVDLENWFPRPSYVESRGGSSSHATGMTGNGKTLATYNKLAGTSEMFCYTASGIYDVSSSGAVGASKLSRTVGKHQWVNFGDGTNNYLIAVNGTDKPAYYNGTTWTAVDGVSSPALTGLTTTKIIGVFVFKGRLIFIEKDSLSFWYLDAGSAGGSLTEFPLDANCPRGGYLVAGATVDALEETIDVARYGVPMDGRVLVAGMDPELGILVNLGGDRAFAMPKAMLDDIRRGTPLG